MMRVRICYGCIFDISAYLVLLHRQLLHFLVELEILVIVAGLRVRAGHVLRVCLGRELGGGRLLGLVGLLCEPRGFAG